MKKVVLLLGIVHALVACDSVRRIQKQNPDEFPIDIYKECVYYCNGDLQEHIVEDSLHGEWKWKSWGGDKIGLTLTEDGRYACISEWRDCPKKIIEGNYEWMPEQNKLVLHDYYTRKQIRRDYDLRLKYANLPHKEMIVTMCKNNELMVYHLGGITIHYVKE